jgi:hypothetical protein
MPVNELVLPSATPALDPLLERVRTLISNAQGSLTRSGYRKDFERYQHFCSEHNLVAVPAQASRRSASIWPSARNISVSRLSHGDSPPSPTV